MGRIVPGLALVLLLGYGACRRNASAIHPVLSGETMGTAYCVKVSGRVGRSRLAGLASRIEAELAGINRQMSTWDPDSDISRFNRMRSTDPFEVPAAFAAVAGRSLELAEASGGAFDPTVPPLLDLWGFRSGPIFLDAPSEAQIAEAKASTGWRLLALQDRFLRKAIPELALDLGAIAKGYGVDAVARILDAEGLANYFVEIGGEVRVLGTKPDGAPWRIGIQFPSSNPMDDRLHGILHLRSGAVATSGDYRNYRIDGDGTVHSHLLDPRTGRAARSPTASVTVLAPSCLDADGIATALFVMGAEEGLAWTERMPGIEALFIERGGDGQISERISSGFRRATGYVPAQSMNGCGAGAR